MWAGKSIVALHGFGKMKRRKSGFILSISCAFNRTKAYKSTCPILQSGLVAEFSKGAKAARIGR
jgi:hypothetical protein